MKKLLVTGSSGLIGSECVTYFEARGWQVYGIDNNMRKHFFGAVGDTTRNLEHLRKVTRYFEHHPIDIRKRDEVFAIVRDIRPDYVIHCAAQPGHDLAATIPLEDFDVNAVGTMNLLEAVRRYSPDATFGHMSTNKVYGDVPNELPLKEMETRWDYADKAFYDGIAETMRIDRCTHSLFGASKVAADVMVQEYGRYFGMKTACFRGGCLTGPAHCATEQHGFLAHLIKCVCQGARYRIFGHKGKQVRDNLHAFDVCSLLEAFYLQSRSGEVYNLGGGRENSISVIEAIALAESVSGRKLDYEYVDRVRRGDHICYISDLSKLHAHFPQWRVTRSLTAIFEEIAAAVPRMDANRQD